MTQQVPSVGRLVHYVSYGTPGGEYSSTCRAAMITEVADVDIYKGQLVDLAVFNPEGLYFNRNVLYDGDKKHSGTWHWPEQVGPPGNSAFA